MFLMIDNYDSFTYNLVQYMAVLGSEPVTVRNDEIDISGIEKLDPDAIILSPGPGRPEDAGIMIELINRFAGVKPILGVCLGHQAIGAAFGGKIVAAKSIMHGKTSRVEHDDHGVFRGMSNPFEAGRYHSLVVDKETLPDCFEISARTEDGEIMGLRHREHKIEGVQFHPESVLTPQGKRLLRNFIDSVKRRDSDK